MNSRSSVMLGPIHCLCDAGAPRIRRATMLIAGAALAACSGAPQSSDGTEPALSAGSLERVAAESSAESAESRANEPTHTSPIALSADGSLLWAIDVDGNSVSVIRPDSRTVIGKIAVGNNPQSVALDPASRFAYVANAGTNDVSVIDIGQLRPNGFVHGARDRRIVTGGSPSSVVVAPDGRRVFVANGSQDTITVLDGDDQRVLAVIDLRNSACNASDPALHFHPRAMAVTGDSEHLYVTRFLSYTRSGGVQADDHGKEGLVCRIDLARGQRWAAPQLTPIALAATDSGFLDTHGNPTAAFPNQLDSIVIRAGHAYLPNIAASPSGPIHFDVDTQAYVNRIDGVGRTDTDQGALNLHLGGRVPEAGKLQLFFANPHAIGFTTPRGSGNAYVVSSGSDLLVKLDVNDAGVLQFTGGDSTTRYIDLNDPDSPVTTGRNAGKNPIGLAIDRGRQTAYVLNYVSRNVSVVDLTQDSVESVINIAALPVPGSEEETRLVGAEVFFSSRGDFVRPAQAQGSSRDRLSEEGHQGCASCHPGGLTDGVIWQFNSGPRKTIAINGTTNPRDRSEQRIINASAIFDEFEDVEFNTRRVSGIEPLASPRVCINLDGTLGQSTNDPDHGLIVGEEGDFSMAPCVLVPFTTSNANRPQALVQLPGSSVQVPAEDALKEWQRTAIITPNRALTATELAVAGLGGPGASPGSVAAGRALFETAGCVTCHGSGQWTEVKKDFVSPPAATEIATETAPGANAGQFLFRFLTDVGTFDLNVAGATNAITGTPAIGGAEIDTNGLKALGFDYDGDGKGNGYNTPSLLGAFSIPPYFHNGACETLQCVLADVTHRRAKQADAGPDPLDDPGARRDLALFLESIDESTEPLGGVQ